MYCKKLDREVLQSEEFKKYSKWYVFVKINADQQPNLMQAYQVQGLPTHFVLDAEGAVIDKGVGYGGPSAIYAFLEKNKG